MRRNRSGHLKSPFKVSVSPFTYATLCMFRIVKGLSFSTNRQRFPFHANVNILLNESWDSHVEPVLTCGFHEIGVRQECNLGIAQVLLRKPGKKRVPQAIGMRLQLAQFLPRIPWNDFGIHINCPTLGFFKGIAAADTNPTFVHVFGLRSSRFESYRGSFTSEPFELALLLSG